MGTKKIITVLEPSDEYTHEPDEASNYNESMYFNTFDIEKEIGGWFRLGNRVNEGYAEMSICVYLPNGQVGFMFDRPQIADNGSMKAGGLSIEVVKPFETLQLSYSGKVCLLNDPREMANPRQAFKENPIVDCNIDLDWTGMSPMYGGKPMYEDGSEIETNTEGSFAKAHYEQHGRMEGAITVGDNILEIHGMGLRDKSWGARYWQSISWYRWLPMVFSPDFAMMLSIVSADSSGEKVRRAGMVLEGDEYKLIEDCNIETTWDKSDYQTGMKCWARTTEGKEYEIEGEVISLIPLRNRRKTPDGENLLTRITEAMTKYRCNGEVGIGMSEYLDQIENGRPAGRDFGGQ
tara:strand:- start:305 stop:1348 length:1044 start_codon:yes stop_codon:yes gene_type:complete